VSAATSWSIDVQMNCRSGSASSGPAKLSPILNRRPAAIWVTLPLPRTTV
jgi:hypothetical protein